MNYVPLISEDDDSRASDAKDPRGYQDKDVRPAKYGYTMFNNALIDVLQPMISPEEWGVLCFVLRKTAGWHRDSARMSLSTLSQHCIKGNKTLAAARKAVHSLEAKQLVVVQRPTGKSARRQEMSVYRIGPALEALLVGDVPLFFSSSGAKY